MNARPTERGEARARRLLATDVRALGRLVAEFGGDLGHLAEVCMIDIPRGDTARRSGGKDGGGAC